MRAITKILLSAMLILTAMSNLPVVTMAQWNAPDPESSTYISPLTGITINLGDTGEAEFDPYYSPPAETVGEGGGRVILEETAIWVGNAFLHVKFFEGVYPTSQWELDAYAILAQDLHTFDILGSEVSDEFGMIVTLGVEDLDIPLASFQTYETNRYGDVNLALTIYAHSDDITPTIEWMQNNLTLDGEPVIQEVDPKEIDSILNGESDFEPITIEWPEASIASLSDVGVVSESEWINPDRGDQVTWDTNRLVIPLFRNDIVLQERTPIRTSLLLHTPTNSSRIVIGFNQVASDGALQYEFDWMNDPLALEERGARIPAVDTRISEYRVGGILAYDLLYGELLFNIRDDILMDDGRMLHITVTSTSDTIVNDYFTAFEALTINGGSMSPTYSRVELEAIIYGYAEEAGVQIDATVQGAPSDDASESEWQSPDTGTMISWDADQWVYLRDEGPTLTLDTIDGFGQVVITPTHDQHSISEWVALMTSPEWPGSTDFANESHEILDTYESGNTGSIIVSHKVYGQDFITIVDVYAAENGISIITEITAAESDIADVYGDFWDGVQADGEFYLLTWTLEDIEAL